MMCLLFESGHVFYIFSIAKKRTTFEETWVNNNKYVYFRRDICRGPIFFLDTTYSAGLICSNKVKSMNSFEN